jgi:twitching motility protein PilT
MGSIDPLLGILQLKKATGLVLAAAEVPQLLTGGGRSPLTMPAPSVEMMNELAAEVLSGAEQATLAAIGAVDTVYQSSTQGSFAVRARQSGGKMSLTLTRGSARPASRPTEPVAATRPEPRIETPAGPAASPDARLVALLEQTFARGASDLLISSDTPVLVRVDGELVELRAYVFSSGEIEAMFQPFLTAERRRQLDSAGSADFAVTQPGTGARLRANLFRHATGLGAALRPIFTEVPSLGELHLPPSLSDLVELRHGLVVVSGATGSGKSTTLAALINHLGEARACHVITLEDPIEHLYRRRRALIHQREVGLHVDSFASGLRAALRENPDVLLVGEMRDPETIRMALTAAQTGHLVFSTLHSGSAPMAIERIIDVFQEGEKLEVRQELATALRAVIVQQLLPAAGGGRVPALEILSVNHAVSAQIREGRTHLLATQMEIGADEGMIPMERALADLVRAGRIGRATAFAASQHRESLRKLLDERSASGPDRGRL